VEDQLKQETVTLVVAGFGIAGTFGGMFLGQSMSQSWQREQWLLYRRIEELRELLDALTDGLRVAMMWRPGAVLDSDQQRVIVESQSNAMRVIKNRVFIIDMVERCQLELKWCEALAEHQSTFDIVAFTIVFNDLRREIVMAAHRDHGSPSRLQSIKSRVARLMPWNRKKISTTHE
jgi:hypothetical protein